MPAAGASRTSQNNVLLILDKCRNPQRRAIPDPLSHHRKRGRCVARAHWCSMRNPDGGGVKEPVDNAYLVGEEQAEAEAQES
jgi:hypothetical protein